MRSKIYLKEKNDYAIIISFKHTAGSQCQQGLNHVGSTKMHPCLISFIEWPEEGEREINLFLPPAQMLEGSAARISIQDFFRI